VPLPRAREDDADDRHASRLDRFRSLPSRDVKRVAFASTLAVRGVALLSTTLMSVLVVRGLGVVESAPFLLAAAAVLPLSILGRLGTDISIARRLPNVSDPDTARSILRRSLALAVAGSLAVSALATAIYASVVAEIVPSIPITLLAVALHSGLITSVAALKSMGKPSLATAFENGAVPLLVSIGILFARPTTSTDMAVLYLGASSIAFLTVLPLFSRERLRRALAAVQVGPASTHPAIAADRRGETHPVDVGAIGFGAAAYLGVWAPQAVLYFLGAPEDVTYLSVGLRISSLLTLPLAIQVAVIAREVARVPTHDRALLSDLLRRSTRGSFALSTVAYVVLIVAFPESVLGVFLTDDVPRKALTALWVLGSAQWISAAIGPSAFTMQILGRSTLALVASLPVFVATLVALFVLDPSLSLVSVSIAAGSSLLVPQLTLGLLLARRGVATSDVMAVAASSPRGSAWR
jgi:hypothetical protein